MDARAYIDSKESILQSTLSDAVKNLTINWRILEKDAIGKQIQDKARAGVGIKVIGVSDAEIDDSVSLLLASLEDLDARVCISPQGDRVHGSLLADVLVLVDNKTLLCEFGGTESAKSGVNSALIEITNDQEFIGECNQEIDRLISRFEGTGAIEGATDKATIAKRLTAVKVLIELEDSSWEAQLAKINGADDDRDLTAIITVLQSAEPRSASPLIDDYITRAHALKVWEDPDAALKKTYLKLLEAQVDALANEKLEINRLIGEFEHQKVLNLGDLIEEYLGLRAKVFKEKATEEPDYEEQYQESQAEYEEFTESHAEAKNEERTVLTPEQKSEIKTLLRKLRQKCHPDKVPDELKERAEVLFQRVTEAFKSNDIDLMKQILEQVLAGDFSDLTQPEITDSIGIEERINRFRQELTDLLREINNLVNQPAWKIIGEYDDYGFYFDQQKEAIKSEIERLQEEVSHE